MSLTVEAIIDQIDNNGDFSQTAGQADRAYEQKHAEDSTDTTGGYNVILGVFAESEFRHTSQYDNRFQVKIDPELIALEKKYGMIGMLDRYELPHGDLEALQSIVDYVKLIDNK